MLQLKEVKKRKETLEKEKRYFSCSKLFNFFKEVLVGFNWVFKIWRQSLINLKSTTGHFQEKRRGKHADRIEADIQYAETRKKTIGRKKISCNAHKGSTIAI